MANIGVATILETAAFTRELERLIALGNGKIGIEINPNCIVFRYTVSEIDASTEKFKKEFDQLVSNGYGSIEIIPMGKRLRYEFTRMRKVAT